MTMNKAPANRLWLIDAGYLLKCQRTVQQGYQFSYLKLRERLEQDGPLWRAYYLNSTPNPPSDQQDSFHTWLRAAPPRGPKIITKLYKLRNVKADRPYCETCGRTVNVECPTGSGHRLHAQRRPFLLPNFLEEDAVRTPMSNEGFSVSMCPTCGSSAIRKVSGSWTGNYKGKAYTVKALEYYACPNCNEKVYPPEAMRRIQQASPAYRKSTARRAARTAPNPGPQADA
jgi:YgiT-type zinc finger domain-containing protein